MAIVDKLRSLIEVKGESPTGVMTIADGIKKLVDHEDNALSNMVVDVDIDSGLVVGSKNGYSRIYGDSRYEIGLTDGVFTGELRFFDFDDDHQMGYWLFLHLYVPDVPDVTFTMNVTEGVNAGLHVLQPELIDGDPHPIVALAIDYASNTPKEIVKMTIIAEDGVHKKYERSFDLSGIRLDVV